MIFSTYALIAIIAVILIALVAEKKSKKSDKKVGRTAPGPRQWPIIGSIPFMAKFNDANEAFVALKKQYGDLVSLKLGSLDVMLVSGKDKQFQILSDKSHAFDARPSFPRFDRLFGGNKNNSLAFADWSSTHGKTRNVIMGHTFARQTSNSFANLEKISNEKISNFLESLQKQTEKNNLLSVKSELNELLGSIFVKYFFSLDVDEDNVESFKKMVAGFDNIFAEVNEDCVADVLPFLMPLINKSHVNVATEDVRDFMITKVLNPRLKEKSTLDENNNDQDAKVKGKHGDLLDSFLEHIDKCEDMSLEKGLYCLEDILGGHTAISNFIIRSLVTIASHPDVQSKIRSEVQQNTTGFSTIKDRLPYTEATVLEVTRHISSPIVPHVASEDTVVGDYDVKKGTAIFFNSQEMNFSQELWTKPENFAPERFLVDGIVKKPEYFLPFGTGSRHCLGFRLTLWLTNVIVSNICYNYDISLSETENYEVPKNRLNTGPNPLRLVFSPVSKVTH